MQFLLPHFQNLPQEPGSSVPHVFRTLPTSNYDKRHTISQQVSAIQICGFEWDSRRYSEVRIVACMASMLEEPSRENEEQRLPDVP